ncbi:MAG TPA: DUF2073 domain-containing protein [Candidatus Woesearchaeota archaeon]|nr:DUF2073 domain-containing protein [Candidatus Woesearchaeota archaeon]
MVEKKMLTLEILPYSEIEELSSVGRIRKILTIAKEDKIVLIQGRLTKEEEAELIKVTMEEINKDFKGIELAVLYPNSQKPKKLMDKVKNSIANIILGNSQGLTIVGPANIIKEIKKDPNKIQLFTSESPTKPKRKK